MSTHGNEPAGRRASAPRKTPSGTEIRGHLRRLVRRIREHWPQTRITIRGDGHYGRPEVMEWCDENGVDFIFGLPGNAVLDRAVDETTDDVRTRRAIDGKPCLRGFAETSYQAKSWKTECRACARIEATTGRGMRQRDPGQCEQHGGNGNDPNVFPCLKGGVHRWKTAIQRNEKAGRAVPHS